MKEIDADLACGIALGFLENASLVVNLQQATMLDQQGRIVHTQVNWLRAEDQLHQLTKDYLQARAEIQKASSGSTYMKNFGGTNVIKSREEANHRAIALRQQARQLLAERGVLTRAPLQGMRVLG